MAAQEPKTIRYCEKCFAVVPAGQEFCSECGVAMPTGGHSEGSDGEIYPELARANLLRMRAEYKQAEDVCLAILRRFPNNATANTLLGDICAERGDLDQAIDWYELARDIQPNSAPVRDKLENVQQRKAEKEAATTAKQLGLPTTKPKGVFVAVSLLVFIACVGLIAYSIGRGVDSRASQTVVDAPIDVPADGTPPAPAEAHTPTPANPPTTDLSANRPKEDRDVIAALSQKVPEGTRLVDAAQDPRTKDVTLTFLVQPNEDAKLIGARMGSAVFDAMPDTAKVTVRAVKSGKLTLVADIKREDVDRTNTAEWQDTNGSNTQAWVDAVLSNVWKEGTAAPSG